MCTHIYPNTYMHTKTRVHSQNHGHSQICMPTAKCTHTDMCTHTNTPFQRDVCTRLSEAVWQRGNYKNLGAPILGFWLLAQLLLSSVTLGKKLSTLHLEFSNFTA